MDEVFHALADATRRLLLDRLHGNPGQNLTELCAGLRMTRQAVSKHLTVLEASNLVVVRRAGRDKLHYLNRVPIREIYDRWIHRYAEAEVEALASLKRQLEGACRSNDRATSTSPTSARRRSRSGRR